MFFLLSLICHSCHTEIFSVERSLFLPIVHTPHPFRELPHLRGAVAIRLVRILKSDGQTICNQIEKPSGWSCPTKVGGRAKRRGYEQMRKPQTIGSLRFVHCATALMNVLLFDRYQRDIAPSRRVVRRLIFTRRLYLSASLNSQFDGSFAKGSIDGIKG